MAGNVCPKCGKAVMTYGRFFREAEPYRISPCGRRGARLRRSRAVYILLAVGCGACSAAHTLDCGTAREVLQAALGERSAGLAPQVVSRNFKSRKQLNRCTQIDEEPKGSS